MTDGGRTRKGGGGVKYKALGAAMAALVLLCALAATAVEAQEGPYRVHQHLEARSPDAGCGCGGTTGR